MKERGIDYLEPHNFTGMNLYSYCGNNPVMGYDPSGHWTWNSFWNGVGNFFVNIGAAISTFLSRTLWEHIDILLSLGGFIAGFLDYVSDKRIDQKITIPFL